MESPEGRRDNVCEAQGSAHCWYVAAAGDDSNPGTFDAPFRQPQAAVERAGPGDFIYLRAGTEFGLDHGMPSPFPEGWYLINPRKGGRDGEPDKVITLKSYPGEQAVIRGTTDTNLNVLANRSYWRIEGLRIIHGMILVAWYFAPDVHHIWIVDNHVSDATAPPGNAGLIRIHADPRPGGDPRDIFIRGNRLHDLWTSDGGRSPWDRDPDVEHHACFMIQRADGPVEFTDNEAYNCPSFFYFKYHWDAPVLVQGNRLHHASAMGRRRNANNVFRDNVIHHVSSGTPPRRRGRRGRPRGAGTP